VPSQLGLHNFPVSHDGRIDAPGRKSLFYQRGCFGGVEVHQPRNEKAIDLWLVFGKPLYLVHQECHAGWTGFWPAGSDLFDTGNRADAGLFIMGHIGDISCQCRKRCWTDHGEDLWQFLHHPITLFQGFEEREQWLNCCLCTQLTQGAPCMDRGPDFQTVRVSPVQVFIGHHADQIGNLFWAKAQFQIVRPAIGGGNPPVPIGEQLIDRQPIAAATGAFHRILLPCWFSFSLSRKCFSEKQ